MRGQQALDIATERPSPAAILRVDEIGIALYAPPETSTWWELYRQRYAARLTTIAVRMPGDLIDITCADRAHAEWLRSEFRRRGVPQRSLTIHRPAPLTRSPARSPR